MNICDQCGAQVREQDSICPTCQAPLQMKAVPETAGNPYLPPVQKSFTSPAPPVNEGDATGGVIPYKNPQALLAYYLGLLSGLPLIGLPLGIAAFILGIKGLKARKRNPVIKGSIHAGIGVGCGGLFTLVWGIVIVVVLISLLSQS